MPFGFKLIKKSGQFCRVCLIWYVVAAICGRLQAGKFD
jgi:hypothetical protein